MSSQSTSWRAKLGLWAVGIGTLGQVDSSVNIAFPAITAWFEIDVGAVQWLVIAYLLPMSGFVLVSGRLGDLYGHRRIFMVGMLVSLLAHLLSGLAPSYGSLLCLRVFQGLGFGLILGSGPALATFLVDEDLRSRVLSMYTMTFGAGMAVGPIIGGLLIDTWGWQAVFWYRAPLAAIAFLLLMVVADQTRAERVPKLDIAGAVLLVLSLGGLLFTLNLLQRSTINWPLVIALLLGFVACFSGFIYQENRAPDPIIRLAVFRNVDIALLQISSIAINFAGFAILLLFPFYLASQTELSLSVAGVVLAMSPLGMAVAGLMGTGLISKMSPTQLTLASPFLTVVGLITIGVLPPTLSILFMIPPMFAAGVGLGLFQFAFTDRAIAAMPRGDRGVAGSLFMVTRLVGTVAGASGISWLFQALTEGGMGPGIALAPGDFLAAFQMTFIVVGSVLFAVSMPIALFSRS
ncbi:MAG: MFS transporter [Geminicoccales bacterium]